MSAKTPIVDAVKRRSEAGSEGLDYTTVLFKLVGELSDTARTLETHCEALLAKRPGDNYKAAVRAYEAWKREQLGK